MNIHYTKKSDGFTLIELMVTLGIIGILLVAGIPAWNNMMPHFRMKTAAREIANMAHQARMQAVANNRYTEMTVDYTTESVQWRVLPDDPWNKVSDEWKGIDLFEPTGTALGIGTNQALVWENDRVRFRPDGTAVTTTLSKDVAVYLRAQNQTTGEKYRVRIIPSGTIKVQRFEGSTWR